MPICGGRDCDERKEQETSCNTQCCGKFDSLHYQETLKCYGREYVCPQKGFLTWLISLISLTFQRFLAPGAHGLVGDLADLILHPIAILALERDRGAAQAIALDALDDPRKKNIVHFSGVQCSVVFSGKIVLIRS